MSNKTYLGDGVYAEIECEMVLLTTSDGIESTNNIYLDRYVIENLKVYLNNLEKQNEKN